MNVIILRTLLAFIAAHPDADKALRGWNRQVRASEYASFADVKADFPSADWVGVYIVFDIMGNKYRVIVRPDFEGKRFYIRFIGTHKDYDAWTQEMRGK